MTKKEKRGLAVSAVLFVLAALLPFTGSGYWLSIGVSLAMYTVLATAWAMFSGPTNYISLASAAFFGVGMYVVAGGIEVLPFPVLVLLAGLAGVWLASDQHQFTDNMTGGRGYIALAAMIVGRWRPGLAAVACLLFGAADAVQMTLAGAGIAIPSQFLQMLPYVLTIVAVVGFMGRATPPAAVGQPYDE